MLWLVMLVASVVLATIGKRARTIDEVYALALYCGSLFSGWCGLATAPDSAQIILGTLILGGVQLSTRHS